MNFFKVALYGVAVLLSLACTLLLGRGYARQRIPLMMWSAICFVGLTVNNVALFLDLVIFPNLDLRLERLIPALAGVVCLLCGFVRDGD
jgi:hypothetical protein